MNSASGYASRGFYRRSDKAMIGGVCAGIAEHFGFNLRVTRLLAIIALLAAFPFAVVGYLAAVVLIPAHPSATKPILDPDEERIRETVRRSPSMAAAEVQQRSRSIEERLAKLEKYVTSSRYSLDREFDRL
ncbi:MAG: PspC domain-containing protein [Pseudomonadota bacterium]